MKVFWLNADMTEAIVERGWLWWKRRASLRRMTAKERLDSPHTVSWVFVPSGRADNGLSSWLDSERDVARLARDRDNDWQPVRALPEAQVVKR